MKKVFVLFLLLLPFIQSNAQFIPPVKAGTSTINGTVVDAASHQPVAYATVSVIEPGSGKILIGALTDSIGKFIAKKLPAGTYNLKVSFVSYTDKAIPNIQVAE